MANKKPPKDADHDTSQVVELAPPPQSDCIQVSSNGYLILISLADVRAMAANYPNPPAESAQGNNGRWAKFLAHEAQYFARIHQDKLLASLDVPPPGSECSEAPKKLAGRWRYIVAGLLQAGRAAVIREQLDTRVGSITVRYEDVRGKLLDGGDVTFSVEPERISFFQVRLSKPKERPPRWRQTVATGVVTLGCVALAYLAYQNLTSSAGGIIPPIVGAPFVALAVVLIFNAPVVFLLLALSSGLLLMGTLARQWALAAIGIVIFLSGFHHSLLGSALATGILIGIAMLLTIAGGVVLYHPFLRDSDRESALYIRFGLNVISIVSLAAGIFARSQGEIEWLWRLAK